MSKQENQPVNGRNRQERRQAVHNPQPHRAEKPLALRIAIIVMLAVMLLGFVLLPLMR